MQFNIIFKTIFEYIHDKFCFVHTCTNTFCKYRKKLLASPRVHLVYIEINIFEHFEDKIIIQHKELVFHSVLLGACLQPCSKRASRYNNRLLYSYKRRTF